MKKNLFLILFVLVFVPSVHAAQKSRIELTDGGIFEGEIVSLNEGRYTIKNSSIGTFKVEASRVRSIRSVDQAAGSSPAEASPSGTVPGQSDVQKLQSAITGNPDIMAAIPGLVSNPNFRTLLDDPEIVSAAKAMDIKTLLANQKVMKAINDPTIQKIAQKVKEKKE